MSGPLRAPPFTWQQRRLEPAPGLVRQRARGRTRVADLVVAEHRHVRRVHLRQRQVQQWRVALHIADM